MAHTNNPTVTIAAGAAQSSALNVDKYVITGFITDAAWDTAALGFLASYDGTNFFTMYNGATELSYAAFAASRWTVHDPAIFLAVRYIKVRSGTAASEVNQVDETVVTVITRPI